MLRLSFPFVPPLKTDAAAASDSPHTAQLKPLSQSRRLAALRALALIVLAGCTPNQAYRDLDSRPWAHSPQKPFVQGVQLPQFEPRSTSDPSKNFDVSYIEFDEKGDYWDRRQLGWTTEAIRRATHASDTVLVVYVHGWQNDASPLRGHDVEKFHCLLEHLSAATGGKQRFFGVYLAWRGKSVPGGDGWFRSGSLPDLASQGFFFVPHELSFFGRKDAATRVAGLPVTEAIFQSVAAARSGARESGHLARTILVGHSFGALLLEKAMAQAIGSQVVSLDPRAGGRFTAPADLVVLLNSAGESIYAKEMQDLLRRRSAGKGTSGDEISPERPLIVSVTSSADWATGILFPIGTELSNTTGLFREYQWDERYGSSSHNVDQRQYFTQTPGHNDHLISHNATPNGPSSPPVLGENTCDPNMFTAFRRNLEEPLLGPHGEIQFVTVNPSGRRTIWSLDQNVKNLPQTPYWIVQVPHDIIRSHTDIFNENSIALLARLFRVSNPLGKPGITMSSEPRTMRLQAPVSQ